MRKISIEHLIERISKEEFESYYLSHNTKDCTEYFSVTPLELKRLSEHWNIVKTRKDVAKIVKGTLAKEYGSFDNYLKYWSEKVNEAYWNKSEDERKKISSKRGRTLSNKSKEEKERANKRSKNTCQEKYGVDFPAQSKLVQETRIKNIINKYGSCEYFYKMVFEKASATCKEKYEVSNVTYLDSTKEKSKETCMKKYGAEHYSKTQEYRDRVAATSLERYGETNYNKTEEAKEKYKKSCLKKYGVDNASKSPDVIEKIRQTSLERFGVDFPCMTDKARNFTNNSVPNKEFAKLLDDNMIEYEREFVLGRYSYDFKVGNVLIEINPFATHNSTWGLFGEKDKKDRLYHKNKTVKAIENGFRCIHVWDWDSKDKVINLLKNKNIIYARNCEIKDVPENELIEFLNRNHLQGFCKGQKIKLGLYYQDNLVQVMTFGTPRYNKNYEYELIRLCSENSYTVTGGAEKLFKNFLNTYNPKSIVSYCDNSKFTGDVYTKLGFSLKTYGEPSKHWYNGKKHFTDNLLRSRGADQLIGTNFGKGTNNENIMKQNWFVEIYDCGQSVFEYKTM